jgi:hypothetical protein
MRADEMQSALFAQLVMQQSSMAAMLMGKTPNPETGKVTKDLEAARFFIDCLEMLEAKTKGNLTKEEGALLKQTLMSLRMAYVDAVNAPGEKTEPAPTPRPAAETLDSGQPPQADSGPEADEEHKKKFTKKY